MPPTAAAAMTAAPTPAATQLRTPRALLGDDAVAVRWGGEPRVLHRPGARRPADGGGAVGGRVGGLVGGSEGGGALEVERIVGGEVVGHGWLPFERSEGLRSWREDRAALTVWGTGSRRPPRGVGRRSRVDQVEGPGGRAADGRTGHGRPVAARPSCRWSSRCPGPARRHRRPEAAGAGDQDVADLAGGHQVLELGQGGAGVAAVEAADGDDGLARGDDDRGRASGTRCRPPGTWRVPWWASR